MGNRQCPVCGNEYSETYRKCPFCEEEAARQKGKTIRRRGGKRLDKKKRSGGAGGVLLLVMALVVAGVVGYAFFGQQLAELAGIRTADSLKEPPPSSNVQTNDKNGPGATDPGQDPTGGEADPSGAGSSDVPDEPAGPLTLSQSNITIAAGETGRIIAQGGSGEVAWTSSNDQIASVDGGAVTGVAGGTVTITATAGEETQTCSVTVTGDPWVNPVKLTLNREDFTMGSKDSTWQMKVSGTDSTPVWASNNTNVVTISETGLVKKVGRGTTTITATVDGQVLTCIVRVS